MLRRSPAGINAINARYYAGLIAQRGEEKAMNGTNGAASIQREKVQFEPNVPVRLALKYAQPHVGTGKSGEYALFTTVDNRVMFMDLEEARVITMAGIRPGQEFDLTLSWGGKRSDPKIYRVSLPGPAYGAQRDGTYAVPSAPEPVAEAESDLAYELRMSVEMERIKAELAARKKRAGVVAPAPAAAPTPKTPERIANGYHTPAPGPQPPAPGQYNGRGEGWQTCTLAMAKELVAIYADALAWAREEYGVTHTITGEDVRQLVSGAHIRVSRG
jgi:hypothetical protein